MLIGVGEWLLVIGEMVLKPSFTCQWIQKNHPIPQ
jgi:hypothetical protein